MNSCPICHRAATYTYCSLSCSNIARLEKNEVKYLKNPKKCKECSKPVPYLKRTDNIFCSSSCSAICNNKRRQKKVRSCQNCGRSAGQKTLHCKVCFIEKSIIEFGERTLSSFKSTYARHRYQKVRNHAHRIAKQSRIPKECAACGYDKHVELSHLKAISAFPLTTKLKDVNSLDNLKFLCPTHHWELDANILHLE